nr:MAG TPA: hypothetical protein [Caudoviricetes sp.]
MNCNLIIRSPSIIFVATLAVWRGISQHLLDKTVSQKILNVFVWL